ncbi:MAG TPA: serine/threonine-protein kinase [Thermoanaerobaculia bacterium]|nr:serine/threonine-protein kinase [Thermoanaerobaculia bacterium]
MRVVPLLAGFKLTLGLAAFCVTYGSAAGRDPFFPYIFYGLFAAAFGATAALLLLGGREDRRALALGGFFLVTATSWCNKPLTILSRAGPDGGVFALADAMELDGFMAYFLWTFVRDFPSPSPSLVSRRRIQVVVRISAVAGLLLFILNLLRFAAHHAPGSRGLWAALSWFAPQRGQGFYYSLALALTGAAFPLLLWKARFAQKAEQRRARMFLELLAITFGPMLAEVLLELFAPGYRPFTLAHPRLKLGIVIGVLLPGLTLPVTVPYTVLVHRVLDVRLIARRGLQYALARYTALALIAVPMTALAFYLYAHRGESLIALFSGGRLLFLLSVILIGAAGLRYSRRLLDALDRRFFREQYDARRILTLLVERIRSIQESATLANLVSREIDLALHLEAIAMLVLDPRSGVLVDPRNRARRLDSSSALALAISNASDPLEVDFENPQSALLKLPEKERHWLVDSGFRLIVPILARDGSLLGLVGLGEKKSGLPFIKEDRQLLHAIASSAAWVLELEQGRALPPQQRSWLDPLAPPEDATPSDLPSLMGEHAKECSKCGALHPSFTVFCRTCSRRLEFSNVPHVLTGKFRFERRLGVGGMGIVFQGTDLALGRPVAIKTLRQVSPEGAMRLRREARTAATVSHPNLAPIYGMETWRGTPMLVLELLEGGTLAQRIAANGEVPPLETVELGIAMSAALAQLHAADILHRDIKPSNIGYTRDGLPKLMDFGIARVMFELRREEDLEELEDADDEPDLVPSVAVWNDRAGSDLPPGLRFVGTLSYLSPEALSGHPADASFDLWSLSVVLYECLLGRKVFGGSDQQVMDRVLAGRVPDFAQVCPQHDEALAEFFRDALHRSRSRRPATACELRRRLEEVRTRL